MRSTHLIRTLAAAAVAVATAAAPAAARKPAPNLDVTVNVNVGEPVMIADKEQTAYVKITLGGFALPANQRRAPINLALVLDRSSSMSGDKLEKAKEAAMMVLDRLQPGDILSVISYDSTVEVLVPATKIQQQRDAIREQIAGLTPRGSTALFAGVSYGIEEVSKFLDAKRVNRIVLLSDGQANIGPSSPNELGRLGEVAARQGISITTIGLGLGYNEDLMSQLALRSDGNHAFAENADDLATIFQHELGDVMSVVAQDVNIEIDFDNGIVPVRALGREATIHGHTARLSLSQLYAEQQKYVLFEVKVPPGAAGKRRDVASVAVSYNNMITKKKAASHDSVAVSFTKQAKQVAKHQNKDVMVAAVEAIGVAENQRAVALRDQGKVKEAKKVLEKNAKYLAGQSHRYRSTKLQDYSIQNTTDSQNLAPAAWGRQRKAMREEQTKSVQQRSW